MLNLTIYEKDFLFDLFLQYALKESFVDHKGKLKTRFMRQTRIWIQDATFTQRYKHKRSMHSLFQKKVLLKNKVMGYDFFILEEFKEKVYDLADNHDFDILKQMMSIWIQPQDK